METYRASVPLSGWEAEGQGGEERKGEAVEAACACWQWPQ